MEIENIYTSVGCNCTPECADWSTSGLIAFGASNAVAILDPKYNGYSAKILHTFVQHTQRVNVVRWLRASNGSADRYLLSGGGDHLAILWDYANGQAKHYPLKAHVGTISAVDGIQKSTGNWLLATSSADSHVNLWHFDGNCCELLQSIDFDKGFAFALNMVQIPQTESFLLAVGMDDNCIRLLAQTNEEDMNFYVVHKLTGHENWVRGLDFVLAPNDDLLLASASQDHFIRLWRFSRRTHAQEENNAVDLLDIASLGEIRVEEKILKITLNAWYAISLESVLYGHSDIVYGVKWHGMKLLSSSMDKTLVIWEPHEDGVWMESVRVGEVGGNSLGFFGGKFSPDGKSIVGHSFQGGLHIWSQSDVDGEQQHWLPQVIVGGHFGQVRDMVWESTGKYVMTVSADQTTRIHAPWLRSPQDKEITWHELARPQVHGYDMQAVAILGRYKFASAAEEKIVRTFTAPLNFIENLIQLSQIKDDAEGDKLKAKLPKGASVPSLGLSNKAVYEVAAPDTEQRHIKDQYPEHYFAPMSLADGPPQEETLMQNTLWPEVQKLYGHGYEVYALAASSDGALLASSCRSTNANHSQIILWNTANWQQVQKLASHHLTVTQMRFSPDDQYLLSVSRDRRWSLFERRDAKSLDFVLAAASDKTNGVHARIIWSCDWSPDGRSFVTSSRDGKAVIWSKRKAKTDDSSTLKGWLPLTVLELKNESITALAYAPHMASSDKSYEIIAMGFQSGGIHIYKVDGKIWTLLKALSNDEAHHLCVKKLQFRPIAGHTEKLLLASCGEDHLVRIYQLN